METWLQVKNYKLQIGANAMPKKLVGVNENGARIGQDHQRAKLTDNDVEHIRILHEEHGIGYRRLSEKFGVDRATIRDICKYRIRAQSVFAWRVVETV